MADLLPCPFCGSTNLRHEFSGSQGYIECNECGTQGPCDERAADPICDYDAAYAAWNRRAAAQADGPAVPEGREPASVVSEPSDRELLELMPETMRDEFAYAATTCSDATGGQVKPRIFRVCLNTAALEYARAVLARWGTPNQAEIRSSLGAATAPLPVPVLPDDALIIEPAEHTLLVPVAQPVPVSERLPGPEDCDAEGRCWLLTVEDEYPQWRLHSIEGNQPGGATMIWVPVDISTGVMVDCFYTSHWLPAHALPIPQQQETNNDH